MSYTKYTKKCYFTHKPLEINGHKIYGGACSYPVETDFDIYVGFDRYMEETDKAYPWTEGESFYYPITDQRAPSDKKTFLELIDWLQVQLTAGKKIHLGCVGGHGRTGLVLAALVSKMTGMKDAIKYVRDNYCEKAVESQEQVDFLVQNFGCKTAIVRPRLFVPMGKSKSKWVPKATAFEIDPVPKLFPPLEDGPVWSQSKVVKKTKVK